MNFIYAACLGGLKGRFRGMFNLNDPRWGRGDDKQSENNRPDAAEARQATARPGPNQGPPDLDELWRDFNRKLGGLFGGKGAAADNGGGAAAAAISSPT